MSDDRRRGRRFVAAGPARGVLLLGLVLSAPVSARAAELKNFEFHHENVLGTSLELIVVAAAESQAQACEQAVLREVRRLEKILSTRDGHSEISVLNAGSRPVKCSPELLEVLGACELWRGKSGGAFNAHIGKLIETWAQAAKAGKLPDQKRLAELVGQINRAGCELDEAAGTVRLFGNAALNVDALAKGYIVDKALAAAAKVPGAHDLLLNLGGDIGTWSRKNPGTPKTWTVGVADPKRPHDNSPVEVCLRLQGSAVATSGGYERYYTIGGKRYSHILDPRTGRPAEKVISSTVVARDCMTADALATILSVLQPRDGLRLIKTIPDAECLIVAADGRRHRSAGWSALLAPTAARPNPAPKNWPQGYQATLTLKLKRTWIRPYVAIWIEDTAGRLIRTLTVWGKKKKYLKLMLGWWRHARNNPKLIAAVTRASRSGGRYTLVWDGTDDQGNPVPRGTYVVRVELYRKEGKRFDLKGRIECGAVPATGRLPDCPEVKDLRIRYGAPQE